MALDMSDIVDDPDFITPCVQCYRRPRTTSNGGLAVITLQPFMINATVVPASGRQLQRLADADRTSAGIAVFTTTPLQTESTSYAADLVVFKGQNYILNYLDDFSLNGFYAGVCTLTDIQGPDPDIM
jgi:hypothetical protein